MLALRGACDYNVFGWQKPCYLLQDGYWIRSRSCSTPPNGRTTHGVRNPSAQIALVHSGYEASAVDHTFSGTAWTMGDCKGGVVHQYNDSDALAMLNERSSRCTLTTLSFRSSRTRANLKETRA